MAGALGTKLPELKGSQLGTQKINHGMYWSEKESGQKTKEKKTKMNL